MRLYNYNQSRSSFSHPWDGYSDEKTASVRLCGSYKIKCEGSLKLVWVSFRIYDLPERVIYLTLMKRGINYDWTAKMVWFLLAQFVQNYCFPGFFRQYLVISWGKYWRTQLLKKLPTLANNLVKVHISQYRKIQSEEIVKVGFSRHRFSNSLILANKHVIGE